MMTRSPVGEDAPAALLVEHAVVVGAIRHDVALVAGDDRFAQVGALGAPVLQPAVAARSDLDLHPQLEVLRVPPRQTMKRLYLRRAVGSAGEAAVLDRPVVRAPLPAGEVAAVEDRLEALGRLRGGSLMAGKRLPERQQCLPDRVVVFERVGRAQNEHRRPLRVGAVPADDFEVGRQLLPGRERIEAVDRDRAADDGMSAAFLPCGPH